MATAHGPAAVTFNIVLSLDTRQLPAGTSLYIGYGRDLSEVVTRGHDALVRTF